MLSTLYTNNHAPFIYNDSFKQSNQENFIRHHLPLTRSIRRCRSYFFPLTTHQPTIDNGVWYGATWYHRNDFDWLHQCMLRPDYQPTTATSTVSFDLIASHVLVPDSWNKCIRWNLAYKVTYTRPVLVLNAVAWITVALHSINGELAQSGHSPIEVKAWSSIQCNIIVLKLGHKLETWTLLLDFVAAAASLVVVLAIKHATLKISNTMGLNTNLECRCWRYRYRRL